MPILMRSLGRLACGGGGRRMEVRGKDRAKIRVVAPSGEKSRAMRKSIIKLFLSEADSLLTRVSAVQGLVQDCLALQQEV